MKTAGRRARIHSEILYLAAILLLALAVAMTAAADFGVSMIVAPAYLVSLRFSVFTFGQSEYLLQGVMIVVFCLLMKRVRIVYFSSFATCLLYGAILDGLRSVIPLLNPAVTAPGSMSLPIRIALFAGGMVLTSFSVALFFGTYLYPQVYDFFVKGVSAHFHLNRTTFKRCYDAGSLAVSVALSLIFFGKFVGIGIGTLIMTAFNGLLIGWFDKQITAHVEIVPLFPRLAEKFALQ